MFHCPRKSFINTINKNPEVCGLQDFSLICPFGWWEQRESNPRPSACKADALNQLSYAPFFSFLFGDYCVGLRIVGQSFTKVNSFPPHSSALYSPKINFKRTLFIPGDFYVMLRIISQSFT